MCGFTQTINDWFDRELDAINEPYRPIPSGAISELEVYSQIAFLLVGSIVVALQLDGWAGNDWPVITAIGIGMQLDSELLVSFSDTFLHMPDPGSVGPFMVNLLANLRSTARLPDPAGGSAAIAHVVLDDVLADTPRLRAAEAARARRPADAADAAARAAEARAADAGFLQEYGAEPEDAQRAREVLGIKLRDPAQSMVDGAKSLFEHGILSVQADPVEEL